MGPIVESFLRRARDRPGRPALWSRGEGVRLSFGELAARVDARLRRLERIPRLDAVALATGNGVAFCELFLALRRCGAAVVVMDGELGAVEKRAVCGRLGVSTLLHRPGSGAGAGAGGVALGDGVVLEHLDPGPGGPAPLPAGTDVVKLTSGSTGAPVGVCFGEAQLAAGIGHIAEGMELTADDRVLLAIPMSHSYGFDNGVLSLAMVGTPLVLEPRIFPADLLRALAAGEVTFLPLVPPLVRCLGATPWPADLPLRRVICAGAVLRPDAAVAFHRASGRPVHDFYGSTETGGICFERRPLEPSAAGTVGQPLPGVTVTLDDAGRVSVASPANRVGYLGVPSGGGDPAVPGPVVTGDLGEWAEGGRLRLTGRTADVLNVGGRKVPAARLEEALRGVGGVLEAAVVGVADPVRGDRAVAFLVTDRWPVDLGPLPSRLTPRELRRLESLPLTPRGKVDRAHLRHLATKPHS